MEALAQRYPFVRLVWLSRNFGQHPATLAGMACTTAEWVVTMDEDGQHAPQDIGKLLDRALETGTQLIYARPVNPPPHGRLRNGLSYLTKWLFVHVLGYADLGRFNSFRLVQGEIARSLAAYSGPNVFLDVALSWMVGRSSQCDVVVRRGSDRPSGYTFGKLLKHFLRLLLTSGTQPLRLISLMGLAAIGLSLLISACAVWEKLTNQTSVQGWTSLIIVICFFSGCILSGLGVIAEYLGATLTMTMGKPLYVVVPRPQRRKSA
jgi:undecaprenyl-phosphate 4-deoxy-4-formamido-L-arabinose transferase